MTRRAVHLIDCDARPFCPRGWKALKHGKNGLFVWDPDSIKLYAPKTLWWSYKNKRIWGDVSGYTVKKRIRNKVALNANVLNYLLDHPELIPEKWKNMSIYFFGTIYHCGYDEAVRCLVWGGKEWHSSFMPLYIGRGEYRHFGEGCPVALLK